MSIKTEVKHITTDPEDEPSGASPKPVFRKKTHVIASRIPGDARRQLMKESWEMGISLSCLIARILSHYLAGEYAHCKRPAAILREAA